LVWRLEYEKKIESDRLVMNGRPAAGERLPVTSSASKLKKNG
jgi:hypothetical protein